MLQFLAQTFALNHFESQTESITVLAANSSSRVMNNRTINQGPIQTDKPYISEAKSNVAYYAAAKMVVTYRCGGQDAAGVQMDGEHLLGRTGGDHRRSASYPAWAWLRKERKEEDWQKGGTWTAATEKQDSIGRVFIETWEYDYTL